MSSLLGDISKFNKISDYVPILNGAIFADLVILFIVYYTRYFNSNMLMKWYETYRLSAVIADIFILVIGMILTRYFYHYVFSQYTPYLFIVLLVVIQIIHDIGFYVFFMNVPRGMNRMFDLFKDYAKEVSYKAILGDSFMIIISGLAAMLFANYSMNTNIILSILMVYIVPYILYTR